MTAYFPKHLVQICHYISECKPPIYQIHTLDEVLNVKPELLSFCLVIWSRRIHYGCKIILPIYNLTFPKKCTFFFFYKIFLFQSSECVHQTVHFYLPPNWTNSQNYKGLLFFGPFFHILPLGRKNNP